MPQTGSMLRTNSGTAKHSCRRSVRVIMLDKQELIIKIEVCQAWANSRILALMNIK